MTTPVSRRAVIGGLTALCPATALAQSQAGPQFGKTPTVFKPPYPVIGKVTRASSALDALIEPDARVEQVVDGFVRVEGPCWVGGADGYLLCSDTRGNAIIKWSPRDGRSVWKCWLSPAPTA
jgi:gluconolactonase